MKKLCTTYLFIFLSAPLMLLSSVNCSFTCESYEWEETLPQPTSYCYNSDNFDNSVLYSINDGKRLPANDCYDIDPPFEVDDSTGEISSYITEEISEEVLKYWFDEIVMLEAFGGTIPDPIPEIDGKMDISFICDIEIYGENLIDTFVNQCELDNLITKLNDFFSGWGSSSGINSALDSFLMLITYNSTIMNGIADSIEEMMSMLTDGEIETIGLWLSDSLEFIYCDLEYYGGEWIIKAMNSILYPGATTKEDVAQELAHNIGVIISGFTPEAAHALLDALEDTIPQLIGDILDVIEIWPCIISIMSNAENIMPTNEHIKNALTEIVDFLYSGITEAFSDFMYDTLDVLPSVEMGILAAFINPSNLRAIIPSLPDILDMEGEIDCITSDEDMGCD